MDAHTLELIVTIACSVLASSGFWTIIQHMMSRNDNSRKLLLGLAHDRIMTLGTKYISRGWITTDEYENFEQYLYQPYVECGGTSANHLMDQIKKLEVRPSSVA